MTTQTPTVPVDQPVPRAGTTPRNRPPREGGVLNFFSHGFLILWSAMVVIPLLWAVMSAFKTSKDISIHPWGMPTDIAWSNFSAAWTTAHIGSFFLHTVVVLVFSLSGTMLLGSMAAYVLARYEFPLNRLIYYLFVLGMVFPIFLILVPLFFVVKGFGTFGIGTYPGLVLVYIAYSLPFTVFFLTSFFRSLPSSVAEAAMIDGASHTRTFFQIMLPMAKPGLVSIGIFNLLGQWNQYLLPLVLNQSSDSPLSTGGPLLTQGLADLVIQQDYFGDYGTLFAGLLISMLPVLAAYIIFQRQIQAGLTAGAVK